MNDVENPRKQQQMRSCAASCIQCNLPPDLDLDAAQGSGLMSSYPGLYSNVTIEIRRHGVL
jgi:hypothetical protein